MQRDVRIGSALGVLLIGAVAAFFFRGEGDPHRGLPRLSVMDVAEADSADDTPEPVPSLGVPQPAPADPVAATTESDWDKPAFLNRGGNTVAATVSYPASPRAFGTPDPIPRTPQPATFVEDSPAGRLVRDVRAELDTAMPTPVAPAEPEDDALAEFSPPSKPDRPPVSTHIVQPGETLSGLAKRYLGSVARYDELFAANRDRLRDPHDLRIGQELVIPRSRPSSIATPVAEPVGPSEDPRDTVPANDPGLDFNGQIATATPAETPSQSAAMQPFVRTRRTPFVSGRYRPTFSR